MLLVQGQEGFVPFQLQRPGNGFVEPRLHRERKPLVRSLRPNHMPGGRLRGVGDRFTFSVLAHSYRFLEYNYG